MEGREGRSRKLLELDRGVRRRLHGKPELLLPTLFGFRVAPSFLLKPYRDQKFKPMIFDQLLESLTMVETDIDQLILIQ